MTNPYIRSNGALIDGDGNSVTITLTLSAEIDVFPDGDSILFSSGRRDPTLSILSLEAIHRDPEALFDEILVEYGLELTEEGIERRKPFRFLSEVPPAEVQKVDHR